MIIRYSKRELAALEIIAKRLPVGAITSDDTKKALAEIHSINREEGIPLRSFGGVGFKLREIKYGIIRRGIRSKSKIEKIPKDISRVGKTEVKHLFSRFKKVICNLLEENDFLKKEITEQKTVLRSLKEVRQAVENFQKG